MDGFYFFTASPNSTQINLKKTGLQMYRIIVHSL